MVWAQFFAEKGCLKVFVYAANGFRISFKYLCDNDACFTFRFTEMNESFFFGFETLNTRRSWAESVDANFFL